MPGLISLFSRLHVQRPSTAPPDNASAQQVSLWVLTITPATLAAGLTCACLCVNVWRCACVPLIQVHKLPPIYQLALWHSFVDTVELWRGEFRFWPSRPTAAFNVAIPMLPSQRLPSPAPLPAQLGWSFEAHEVEWASGPLTRAQS